MPYKATVSRRKCREMSLIAMASGLVREKFALEKDIAALLPMMVLYPISTVVIRAIRCLGSPLSLSLSLSLSSGNGGHFCAAG